MTIYLGIDDTDTPESRGTGRLARFIAEKISSEYEILGVTRHQLYVNDAIHITVLLSFIFMERGMVLSR